MARTVGTVTKMSGQVQVQKADGSIEVLRIGSPIEENDVVMTEGLRSEVTLELEGGREIIIGGNEEVLIDQSVFSAVDEGMSVDVEALQAALAGGADPSDLEETAAGEETLGTSLEEGFVAERGDARGDVEASLRPTASEGPEVIFEAPEGAEVPAAPEGPEGPAAPEGPEGPENAAPIAVDDGDETSVEFYTVNVGGGGGWDGVDISAYRGYGDNAVEAEIWGARNGDHGQGQGLYGKLGVYDADEPGNQQPLIDNMTDGSEWLEFSFDGALNHVEVELANFQTSNSNSNNTDDDSVYWAIYDGAVEGEPIASGTYTGDDLVKDGNVDILTIDSDTPFTTLVIGAPEGEGHDNFTVNAIDGWGGDIDSDYTVFEDNTLVIPEEMLLANDSDPDNDALSITDYDASGTTGTVTWDQDADTFTYDPAGQFDYLEAGQTATDSFEYTLSDGALTDTAVVTINIVGLDNGTVEVEYPDIPSDYA